MTPQELRIGNYVLEQNGQEITTIASITQPENGIFEYEVNDVDGMFIQVPEDEIEPIPITEDWLMEFGFLNGNKQSQCDMWGCWYYDDFKIIVDKDGNFEADVYVAELFLKYIHQLQNLYFSLTGDELTLKK